ncbi:hypothetical protein JP09_004765 [Dehalogenimonas etheniformans]|uniref:Uncharacterized protein n=1 Tax=Dehalogenimonas etheniformans TaxID=1536648 RepID=A0A2P5P749_9CHLR|nr:hypothetical protein JP09_004765 [Dehalogenimonas etheniformans]
MAGGPRPPAISKRASFRGSPSLLTVTTDTYNCVSGHGLPEFPDLIKYPIPGIIDAAHILPPLGTLTVYNDETCVDVSPLAPFNRKNWKDEYLMIQLLSI